MKFSMTRFAAVAFFAATFAVTAVAEEASPADAAATTPSKPWKNETEFSFVSANGNTRSTSMSGKDTFTYKWALTTLELVGGGLGAKSAGRHTAEQYFASEKVSYSLSERNYVFEKFSWDKDRFAGIRNRYDGTVGLGRELVDRPADKLIGEIGGGYTEEYRIGSQDKEFSTGRAYSKYTRILSPTANFTQDAEYIQNLEDPDDFRAKTETAVIAALTSQVSLKVSYLWKHVGQPPTGFGRNDTLTTISLIAVY